MLSTGTNTCPQPWPPLINGFVDDAVLELSSAFKFLQGSVATLFRWSWKIVSYFVANLSKTMHTSFYQGRSSVVEVWQKKFRCIFYASQCRDKRQIYDVFSENVSGRQTFVFSATLTFVPTKPQRLKFTKKKKKKKKDFHQITTKEKLGQCSCYSVVILRCTDETLSEDCHFCLHFFHLRASKQSRYRFWSEDLRDFRWRSWEQFLFQHIIYVGTKTAKSNSILKIFCLSCYLL